MRVQSSLIVINNLKLVKYLAHEYYSTYCINFLVGIFFSWLGFDSDILLQMRKSKRSY